MLRVRWGAAAVVAAIALVCVAGALALASGPSRPAARVANSSGRSTATISYTETDHGKQHGQATTGVKGHGAFAARLGGHAPDIALITLATGIPFSPVARGGSFGVDFNLGATGTKTGTAVVRFKARGLGSVCVQFTAKSGQFKPGDSFVPTAGTLKVLGGAGAAARWSATAGYTLKAITGTTTQKYTFSASAHGNIARARALSATCKSVAKLIPR